MRVLVDHNSVSVSDARNGVSIEIEHSDDWCRFNLVAKGRVKIYLKIGVSRSIEQKGSLLRMGDEVPGKIFDTKNLVLGLGVNTPKGEHPLPGELLSAGIEEGHETVFGHRVDAIRILNKLKVLDLTKILDLPLVDTFVFLVNGVCRFENSNALTIFKTILI